MGVLNRYQIASRLMQHQIDRAGRQPDRAVIKLHPVFCLVHFGSELGHHPAVELNPTFLNQEIGFSPGSYPGLG
jgi:hypothetical protein